MSIFDEDEQLDDVDRTTEIQVNDKRRIDSMRFKFENPDNLPTTEYKGYCRNLSKVDVFNRASIPGLPDFGEIRKDTKVIFSLLRKSYAEKYNDPSLSNVLVIGEYADPDNVIYIYVNNIKDVCNPADINRLMLAVYVHELYHAYFKSSYRYVREMEEPLAEFGALFCLEAMATMGIAEYEDLHFYKNEVAEKKEYLPEYAFGEYIYLKHMHRYDWDMGKLLVNYRNFIKAGNAIHPISSDNPEMWDEAYKELCQALNYVD